MKFYLGTHMPHWLERTDVPLFISRRRLAGRKTLPVAKGRWALDSGGFTELSMHGEWRTLLSTYIAEVRRYRDEIGNLDWAAPMDWMCEPWILAKTGETIATHQHRTIRNYQWLRDLAPDLPFVPVLQGWVLEDYLRHADAYDRAGIDLRTEATVGVGSVCRRQHTGQIEQILGTLAASGLNLHGFGLKVGGLRIAAHHLTSADSLSWSARGRRVQPATCGSRTHASEANCLTFALQWRRHVLATAAQPKQLSINFGGVA
jgi:hypothetical protein